MSEIDLGSLSVEQLEALKGGIDGAIERKRNIELFELREKVDEIVDNSPFTLDEVLEAKAIRKPVMPKYRSLNDISLTWTGRGRKPLWVVAHLEEGGSLEGLIIK